MQSSFWQQVQQIASFQIDTPAYRQFVRDTSGRRLGDRVIVSCQAEWQRDWLDVRLRPRIEEAVRAVAGEPLAVDFVVNGSEPPDRADDDPPPVQAAEADPPALDQIQAEQLAGLDHMAAGWAKHSHYLAQFWRSYLGSTPFDVWDFLRSMGRDSRLQWAEPVEIRAVELARRVGAHSQQITGVWRTCHRFDQALRDDGLIWEQCCGLHPGSLTRLRPSADWPQGRPACRFWRHGALEILEAEGLAVYQKHGDQPRSTYYSVQIYQHPPLLTPRQADRLGRVRVDHRRWLRRFLREQKIELSAWEQVRAYSFLALRDRRRLLAGLDLPAPDNGVLSAIARNNIFFASN
jgi:hypothetical protein